MAHTEKDCLHCAINKIIEERAKRALDADTVINLPDWLDDMMFSVADLICVRLRRKNERICWRTPSRA
jgi:hypothetical protein